MARSPGNTSPTGKVLFTDNKATAIPECRNSVPLDNTSKAECMTSSLPGGTDTSKESHAATTPRPLAWLAP